MDTNIILAKKEKRNYNFVKMEKWNYNFAKKTESTTEEQLEPMEKTEDADTNKFVIYI